MAQVTIDFIAKDQSHGGWSLVLVEEGPWQEKEIPDELRRIQDRLYRCLDAIVDGQFSEAYPDSAKKPLEIRLDAYDVPDEELTSFFSAFSTGVLEVPDYKSAIANSKLVPSIVFSLNIEKLS